MSNYEWKYKGYSIEPNCDCEICLNTSPEDAKQNGPMYRDWNETKIPNQELLERSVLYFLQGIGEDPQRDGLKDTPTRVAKMWMDTINGYDEDPRLLITEFENESQYTGPIILKGAELYSMCAHHLQPFIGEVDIAYQPSDKIVGLSKLVRIARVYAKRLQVQETLTKQIADSLNQLLKPKWVVVRYNAEHYCMRLRGVRIKGSSTTTIFGHGYWPKDIFTVW